MRLLNLGCGSRYHCDWVNIDFASRSPDVIEHNLLNGIPFHDNEFDVVYHSHVLEHFSKREGAAFLAECFRVLKPGGIIRIAVPDLEGIAREYLKQLELAFSGDKEAQNNYNWIMLELYDQAMRTESGGEMKRFFSMPQIPNEKYVFSRMGMQARMAFKEYRETSKKVEAVKSKTQFLKEIFDFKRLFFRLKRKFLYIALSFLPGYRSYLETGKFRSEGEIHQWMYDKFSLKTALSEAGFIDFRIQTAFDSQIPDWGKYELEARDGEIFKPDSLFAESRKPQSS